MNDLFVLIAVRTDREDIGLPVRGILAALTAPGMPPSHVTAIPIKEVTARQKTMLEELMADDNPQAFQTLADRQSA
jgi:hypothetical protein